MAAAGAGSSHNELLLLTSQAGSTFVELFYNVMDSHREDLIHFFKKDSRLVWDGLDLVGERFPAFFRSLPSSKHEVLAVDVQPIGPDPPPNNGMLRVTNLMMVIVTGRVQYGVKPAASGFHHSFLLERDPNPPLGIINDAQAAELRSQGGNFFWVSTWTHRSHKVDLGGAPVLKSRNIASASRRQNSQPQQNSRDHHGGGSGRQGGGGGGGRPDRGSGSGGALQGGRSGGRPGGGGGQRNRNPDRGGLFGAAIDALR